jgi:hypothetical protein
LGNIKANFDVAMKSDFSVEANFDVAVKSDFSVAAMVLSDSNGNIIQAITKRLSTIGVAIGEAQVALLAI